MYYQNKKIKAFISFDYDHDVDLKNLLIGQAENDDSPFEITDMSVKEELSGDWEEKARRKIINAERVVVICGKHTDHASGVNTEVKIAQKENIPYFLLWGRPDEICVKPNAAENDKIYKWDWENLKILLGGR